MSDKFVFQNARIKAIESRLLTSQQLQRISDCGSVAEAKKLLLEMGLGAGVATENSGIDKIFEYEEEAAAAMLREFNADGALDAFLLILDYHNLKALFKAGMTGQDRPVLMPEGLLTDEKLKEGIAADGRGLPEIMAKTIVGLNKLRLEDKLTPNVIDTSIDKAMYEHIFEVAPNGGKQVTDYFVQKVDMINIASFFRCRALGLSEKFFDNGFLAGGELDAGFFLSSFGATAELFKEKCKYTRYKDLVARAVDDGNLIGYEREADDRLLDIWRRDGNDMFSCAPVVGYYYAKLTELKAVKLIVAGIKNRVDPALIKERMRELYA